MRLLGGPWHPASPASVFPARLGGGDDRLLRDDILRPSDLQAVGQPMEVGFRIPRLPSEHRVQEGDFGMGEQAEKVDLPRFFELLESTRGQGRRGLGLLPPGSGYLLYGEHSHPKRKRVDDLNIAFRQLQEPYSLPKFRSELLWLLDRF